MHEGEDPVIPKKTKRKEPQSADLKPNTPPELTSESGPVPVPDTVTEAKRMKLLDEDGSIDEPDIPLPISTPCDSIPEPIVEIKP